MSPVDARLSVGEQGRARGIQEKSNAAVVESMGSLDDVRRTVPGTGHYFGRRGPGIAYSQAVWWGIMLVYLHSMQLTGLLGTSRKGCGFRSVWSSLGQDLEQHQIMSCRMTCGAGTYCVLLLKSEAITVLT